MLAKNVGKNGLLNVNEYNDKYSKKEDECYMTTSKMDFYRHSFRRHGLCVLSLPAAAPVFFENFSCQLNVICQPLKADASNKYAYLLSTEKKVAVLRTHGCFQPNSVLDNLTHLS